MTHFLRLNKEELAQIVTWGQCSRTIVGVEADPVPHSSQCFPEHVPLTLGIILKWAENYSSGNRKNRLSDYWLIQ